MKLTKQQRQSIEEKYGGKCAYCGCELPERWQVDHIKPIYRGYTDEDIKKYIKKPRGTDTIENYNPSCARCNRWKSTFSIEQFRKEISMQIDRMKRDSSQFRLSLDYGIIKETKTEVKFYFEIYNNKTS